MPTGPYEGVKNSPGTFFTVNKTPNGRDLLFPSGSPGGTLGTTLGDIFVKLNGSGGLIQEIGNLFIEKINNTYYAYVEDKFVGQSNDLDELFQNMKNVHNIKTFNIDKINGLTQDEYNLVIQAIEKCYTVV